jgi:hypothetical protein
MTKPYDTDLEAIKLAKEAIDFVRLAEGKDAGIVTALLAIEARLSWLGTVLQERMGP